MSSFVDSFFSLWQKKKRKGRDHKYEISNVGLPKAPPLTLITQNGKGRNERVLSLFTTMSPRGYDGGYTNSCGTNNHLTICFLKAASLESLYLSILRSKNNLNFLSISIFVCKASEEFEIRETTEWESVGLWVSYWDYHLLLSLLFSL